MRFSNVIAILIGVLLVAVITPLSGFLTLAGGGSAMETAAPAGWVVGAVFALAAGCWLIRLAGGKGLLGKGQLAIVFCMLASAVPIMNIGLARPVIVRLDRAVMDYIRSGDQRGRQEYQSLQRGWFPIVPSDEALAWGKARRLIELMDDPAARSARQHALAELRIRLTGGTGGSDASGSQPVATAPADNRPAIDYRAIMTALGAASDNPMSLSQLETRPAELPASQPATAAADGSNADLESLVSVMGVDEIGQFRMAAARGEFSAEATKASGIEPLLVERLRQAEAQSSQAAGKLPDLLKEFDEAEAYRMPQNLDLPGRQAQEAINIEDAEILTAAERADLLAGVERLKPRFAPLRGETAKLSGPDRHKVIRAVADQYMQQFAAMSGDKYDRGRNSFVVRLTPQQRMELSGGSPAGDNLAIFETGLAGRIDQADRGDSADGDSAAAGRPMSIWQKVAFCWRNVPWHIWALPLAAWGGLIICIFLLLMCLAEWLRPGWVVRQNLPFPLVEAAQRLIEPNGGKQPGGAGRLNRMLLAGGAAGFAVICLAALNHYRIVPASVCDFDLRCDLSGILLMGDGSIVLAVSPIVVGIAFLISLEMSFSIWAAFLVLAAAFRIFWPTHASVDSQWGGPLPLSGEQLFGACMCMSAVLIVQARRNNRKLPSGRADDGDRFLNPKLARAGLIVLPTAILACVWHLGMGWIPGIALLLVLACIVLAQAVAAARARAQAGLPSDFIAADLMGMPWLAGLFSLAGPKMFQAFINVAVLPAGALLRLLGQNMDNMVLARRNGVRLGTVAAGTIVAGITAIGAGMICCLLFSHYFGMAPGDAAAGQGVAGKSANLAGVPSAWPGNWNTGLAFVAGGAVLTGMLLLIRRRFVGFPINPIGYIVVLLSLQQGGSPQGRPGTCLIWGGVLLAWILKKLIIARGGMDACNRAKPFFIGLILGSLVCVFAWNILHLVLAIVSPGGGQAAGLTGQFLSAGPLSLRIF
ncbi:MAG: hypothetical protein HZA50_05875 [Planctomycetes bacterium]|nr:hypothetical protein [Planctomycetota bacterium]